VLKFAESAGKMAAALLLIIYYNFTHKRRYTIQHFDLKDSPETTGIMNSTRIILITVLLALLGGCASITEQPTQSVTSAPVVWADDDSEFALVVEDKQDPDNHSGPSLYRHRIIVQEAEGTGRKNVTNVRPYRVGALYYMKRAGYLIVESLLDDGHVKIDRIALQGGSEIPIIETKGILNPCADQPLQALVATQVLPAPDGALLAFAYSPECGEVMIEFLDGRSLIAQDSQSLSINAPATLTWHPDGYLLLVSADQRSWKLQPGIAAVESAYPPCVTPATTSSAIAADGREVWLDGDIAKIRTGTKIPAFGCQQQGIIKNDD
jgi:hypothetical protein